MSPPDDEKTILVVETATKNPGQIALTGTLLTATSGATLMWRRSLLRPASYVSALPAHYFFVRYIEPCDAAYIAQKLRILAERFTVQNCDRQFDKREERLMKMAGPKLGCQRKDEPSFGAFRRWITRAARSRK